MKLTIIIPVYNELATIVRVIERLQQSGCEAFEWIFVDDGSTDGTTQLLRENVPSRQKLIVQIPISYVPRKVSEGKKLTMAYGWTALCCVWKYRK